jgi:TonB family protein
VPVDAKALEREVRAWLTPSGVAIVEAATTDPGITHHLKLDIQTLRIRDGVYIYNVMGRCSLLSDLKLTRNEAGEAQRIWFAHHLAGQKGEAGFQDNLTLALRQTLRELIALPIALPSKEGPQKALGDGSSQESHADDGLKKIIDFEFKQIKVRRQPPAPPYPPVAKANGVQGVVVVMIIIDPMGLPSRVEALSGPVELLMTAIRYALNWEFEPARLNGTPVTARFRLTMPFKLRESPFPAQRR